MSLYRTYRPKVFAEVVGQDHIVTTLENAIRQDKVAHAYLFSGSRGTGKTSVARILAKHLLTKGIGDETLKVHIIKGVEQGNLVDLMEIDAASHTQVDNIRELIEKIQFSPVVGSSKVYIIDEVHMLSKSAFNALLKTLEEPPPYAYFILATTELHKIPETIQSRCQRFVFRRILEEDITHHIQHIADQEHISIDRTSLRAIAHHVQGGMRDAIALLDQLRSLEKISMKDIQERIGETGEEYTEAVLEALAQGNAQRIIELVRNMEDAAVPFDGFLRALLHHVRKDLHKAIEEGRDRKELHIMLDTLLEAIPDVRTAPIPGLVLESTLLSLCTRERSEEKKGRGGWFGLKKEEESIPPTPKVVEQREPSPPSEATLEAPELSLAGLQNLWPTILKDIASPAVKMSLKNGRVRSLQEKTVTVSFPSAFHHDKVSDLEASRAIEQVMERIFKRQLRLECTLEEDHTPPPPTDSVNLAEAAAEVFGKGK